MDIAEIIKMKLDLEDRMKSWIVTFEKDTGLNIDSISLNKIDVTQMNSRKEFITSKVTLNIKL